MGKEYTEAQKRATAVYMKDRHTFRVIVTKSQAEAIKQHAVSVDGSVNAYINRLIEEDMKKGE